MVLAVPRKGPREQRWTGSPVIPPRESNSENRLRLSFHDLAEERNAPERMVEV